MRLLLQEPVYNPQYEAISPTLPNEETKDEQNAKSSKDELMHNIQNTEREITNMETQLNKLKKKQQQLEDFAKKPPEEKSAAAKEDQPPEARNQSTAQIIYAENRVRYVNHGLPRKFEIANCAQMSVSITSKRFSNWVYP